MPVAAGADDRPLIVARSCCVNDFTQAAFLCERFHTSRGFFCAIDDFVMAVTSGEVMNRHAAIHDARESSRAHPEGRSIMMAMISVALFAVVLALPGLLAVLVSREADSAQNAR